MRRALRSLVVAAALATVLLAVEAGANGVDEGLVGTVDPVTGEWHLRGPDGFSESFYFGNPGDVPFVGDWDCDGDETPGLYRQSDGFVYLRNSNTEGIADIRFFFGNPGDVPIAGDFNDDGCDTVSVYRPSESRVFIINELGSEDEGLGAAELDYVFGNPGDVPFVGDFDGDGTDTIGLHRASTGLVYYRNSHTQGIADESFVFGDPGDVIVAADWTGDGTDTVGLFRPGNSGFHLRHTNTQGNADESFDYGIPRQLPVAGATGLEATPAAERDWVINEVPAPVEWGRYASIGFGFGGRPVITHGSEVTPPVQSFAGVYQLALTQCADPFCADASTDLTPWRVSDHTAMRTGADRLPVWSFHDRSRLIVGRCLDTQCATVTYSVAAPQDSSGLRVGVVSSMAIGPDGNPVIAFMKELGGLRVARCVDASCSSAPSIAVTNISGFDRFEIAIGQDQLPLLAVVESAQPGGVDLSARHCSDAACFASSASVIDHFDAGGFVVFASMDIDDDGLPVIAYNDLGSSLNVARCTNALCTSHSISVIEPGVVEYVTVRLGGDGLPFIAFRESGALKVAHCEDLACTTSTVMTIDEGPMAGEFASLAVDPYGMPVVAYFDGVGRQLKVARLGS